jgi:hypothetical protein
MRNPPRSACSVRPPRPGSPRGSALLGGYRALDEAATLAERHRNAGLPRILSLGRRDRGLSYSSPLRGQKGKFCGLRARDVIQCGGSGPRRVGRGRLRGGPVCFGEDRLG